MKCRVCGDKIKKGSKVKVKYGAVCRSCVCRLPESVQADVGNYTARQIRRLFEVIHPVSSIPITRSGMFGICKDSLIINHAEYKLKDIEKFEVKFYPERIGRNPNTVVGTAAILIETKSPHFVFEEKFLPQQVTAGCELDGENIRYRFSYEFEQLVLAVQECLDDRSYDMTDYLYRFGINIQYRNEFLKWMKRQKDDWKGECGKKNASYHMNGDNKPPFDGAKELLGIELPCTASQLKKARNILLKKYHPDNMDGSVEMCSKINEAYAMLIKFVSS